MGRGAAILALLVGCQKAPADAPLTELGTLAGYAYYLSDNEEFPTVARVRLAGGASETVASRETASFFGSGFGRRVALTVNDDIVLAAPDGQNAQVLAAAEGFDWHPKFSPQGDQLLFESSRDAFRELYRYDFGSKKLIRLTNNPEGNFDGDWSPDGQKIAFASSRAGSLDLYVMNADGSDPVRLTRHPGDSIKPQWSPDGQRIAFISGRDGRDDLFSIAPDGRELLKLSGDKPDPKSADAGAYVERFAWRPDGKAIAYSLRIPKRGSRIWLADLAGNRTPLSKPEHDDADPDWSADGRYLLFTSVVNHKPDVWLMRADGTGRTQLTREALGGWRPRWLLVDEGREDS